MYTVEDRKNTPEEVTKPCLEMMGEPTPDGYLVAAEMGINEELCPYGCFVEEFPLHPDGKVLAEKYNFWCHWVNRETKEPMEWVSGIPGTWIPCNKEDEGAVPDLNTLASLNLLKSDYSCPVFGHDCPVFYGFSDVPEDY